MQEFCVIFLYTDVRINLPRRKSKKYTEPKAPSLSGNKSTSGGVLPQRVDKKNQGAELSHYPTNELSNYPTNSVTTNSAILSNVRSQQHHQLMATTKKNITLDIMSILIQRKYT